MLLFLTFGVLGYSFGMGCMYELSKNDEDMWYKYGGTNTDAAILTAILWPIFLPILLGKKLIRKVDP